MTICSASGAPPDFTYVALWRKRAHAGWRLGELTGDRAAFARAIADLERAHHVFNAIQDEAPAGQTAALLGGPRASLQRMERLE